MTWSNGLTRRQAATLRALAEAYLTRLRDQLAQTSPGTPPEPGRRVRPYVLLRLAVDDVDSAIAKLRRIETS